MPNEKFFSYIMTKTRYIKWDDVRFVLDQYIKVGFYSAILP
jgi:hypothetical protein